MLRIAARERKTAPLRGPLASADGLGRLSMPGLRTQGQRTLSCFYRKDFGQEVVAPAGHLLFVLDAVLRGVALQQTDGEAS